MFPADFAYARARSLDDALSLLGGAQGDGDEAKVIAGGQSLLPMMKLRLAVPQLVVDIADLTELKGVTAQPNGLRIGALTTYRELGLDPRVTAAHPAIADALAVLADPQVRARGTIGGCIAHGDPAADLPAVLLALDARVTIASRARTRTAPLDEFMVGVFSADLAEDELVTAITLPPAPVHPRVDDPPIPPRHVGQAYEKFAQPASHLPLAGACAVIEVKDQVIASARVAVTGIAPRAFRAHLAERELASRPAPAFLQEWVAADTIAASLDDASFQPLADQHASGPFRVHLAGVLAKRAVARALSRAVG